MSTRKRRIWTAIIAHVLASYAYCGIALALVSVSNDPVEINPYVALAPITVPLSLVWMLVSSLAFAPKALGFVLLFWAAYLVPFALVYFWLKRRDWPQLA